MDNIKIEIIERRNVVRFIYPDGREIEIQAKDHGVTSSNRLEVRGESSISCYPMASNCIGVELV